MNLYLDNSLFFLLTSQGAWCDRTLNLGASNWVPDVMVGS